MDIRVEDAKPLHDRVLVKPFKKEEERTASGIIIPSSSQDDKGIGTVVELGTGIADRDFVVKKGQTVLYGKFAGQEVQVAGEDLLVMRETDILLKIES